MKDLEQRKKDIQARVQKEVGFRASPETMELIDEEAGPVLDSEDLEAYELTLISYLTVLRRAAISEYLPSPKTPKNLPQKQYPRPFNKRLHLVDFIIGRQLTIRMHRQRSFSPRKRINWKQTCEAWNKAHLYDPVTPAVLKATFYRAITEEQLQREYFVIKDREMAEQFGKLLLNFVTENKQAFERFGEALKRFGRLAGTAFEKIGQFALNHKDDIENLVLLSNKLNSMTDSEQEEYIKSLEAEFENKKEAHNERTHRKEG